MSSLIPPSALLHALTLLQLRLIRFFTYPPRHEWSDLRSAEGLYTQAMSAAAARELEASPAFDVVDDLSDGIRRNDRRRAMKTVWWSEFAFVLVLLALLAVVELSDEESQLRARRGA